ncbi:MAG: glucosyltransferase domain-containing protein [Lachnospiraceae bacterium]|nr:glucosyltransferase domain-containing protein [Lachnospiraceae bacterium]
MINFDDDWEKVTGRRFETKEETKAAKKPPDKDTQEKKFQDKKPQESREALPAVPEKTAEKTAAVAPVKNDSIIDRVRLFYSFIGTFIFYMAANAFECFNFIPRYDALNYIDHFADSWEVRLGRFLQPLYGSIRGNFQLPWVVGMLSIIYIALAVYLLTDMLKIKNKWYIMLVGGILSANITVTSLNASYTFLVDAYMFSLLMSVLGVYLINKRARLVNMLLGSLCFFIALGMYQAFASVILVTVSLIMIRDLLTEKINLRMFLHWVCHGVSLLLGVIWYYFFYQEEIYRLGVEAAGGYNGLGNLSGNLGSGVSAIPALVGKNYLAILRFFFINDDEVTLECAICNYVLVLILIICFIRLSSKRKTGALNVVLAAVLGLILLPLAMMLISIGMGNIFIMYRVSYALFFLYILMFALSSWESESPEEDSGKRVRFSRCLQLVSIVCSLIILCSNIRVSNEVYVLQKIMYDRTLSYVTRIADDVTAVDGYDRQNMRVVIVGDINSKTMFNFELIRNHYGIFGEDNTALSYEQTITSYLSVLRNNMTIEEEPDVINQYKAMPEVQEMPAYPKDGYCRLIGDRVVVKLPE